MAISVTWRMCTNSVVGRDCLRVLFRKPFPPPLHWVESGVFAQIPQWVESGWKVGFDPLPKTHFWTHFSPLTKPILNQLLVEISSSPTKRPWGSPDQHNTNFSCRNFWTPLGVRDIPAKFPRHPRFLPSTPKEDKLSRESANFSATTPSRGRPPPHRAVSGPQKVSLCALFPCLNLSVMLS